MDPWPDFPVIYEINTWVWLDDLSRQAGEPVTLGSVPQAELERLADLGFDALWLMGVWQRSPAGRRIARAHPDLQAEYRRALPDFSPEDVVGSPYAVHRYRVDTALGGDEELVVLRERLQALDLKLLLDFVPNHLAVDHPWLAEHPERFVNSSEADLRREPGNYFRARGGVFAHGRDPTFSGWSDTVQLDYRRPETRRAMTGALLDVARRCDGVRCDMAMLVTREIFSRTWGGPFDPPEAEFWPAAIGQVKAAQPGFLFVAEVYWDREFELQQMGFDYTYDKRLYDRLKNGDPAAVGDHLRLASFDYQRRLLRFIENHDEPRATAAFGPAQSRAAAIAALTLPGARLLHQGQMEGHETRLPVQLGRRRSETPDPDLEAFYRRLLGALRRRAFHEGHWQLLAPREAWAGNPSHRNYLASRWTRGDERWLAVSNLAPHPSQCFLPLELPELAGWSWEFQDVLSDANYRRDGDDLLRRGLYLDVPGYGAHLFQIHHREKE